MDIREVHGLARTGRAIKARNHHAGKRGVGFLQILTALERCYHLETDLRQDEVGQRLHPAGWFALANLPHQKRLRIDFDVVADEQGNLLLIVTAYEV